MQWAKLSPKASGPKSPQAGSTFADDNKTHLFSVTFTHLETPNTPGYQDDIVNLPVIDQPDFVHVDGVEYTVQITGFSRNGIPITEFRSPEGESSRADIIATFKPTNSLGS